MGKLEPRLRGPVMRLRVAVAMMVAALASVSPAATPTVKAGVEAWQRGDHQAATAIWRDLAPKTDDIAIEGTAFLKKSWAALNN